MSWFKKLKDRLVNISDLVLMSFNERNFMEDVDKMHKLNEDLHNTLYAKLAYIDRPQRIIRSGCYDEHSINELGDIDRQSEIEKGYWSGTGLGKQKTEVSFCGQLLNLPVESDDAWRGVNDELTDFVLANGRKYPIDSPIISFEINGEKFELNEGEGVEIENRGAKPISISSFVKNTAWENPKFVWEWERKSERQQKAILEILNSYNP